MPPHIGMGRSPRLEVLCCQEEGLAAAPEVHPSTASTLAALLVVVAEAQSGVAVVVEDLISEWLRRPSCCRQGWAREHATSKHLCALHWTQCQCRSHPHSRSRPALRRHVLLAEDRYSVCLEEQRSAAVEVVVVVKLAT
jgi:hypothetical protein